MDTKQYLLTTYVTVNQRWNRIPCAQLPDGKETQTLTVM